MVFNIIWSTAFGLIILYLQALIMPSLQVMGIIPNLIIPWMIYMVFRKPFVLALSLTFIVGVLYDTTMPVTLGMNTLFLVLLALGIEQLRKPFEKDSQVALALIIILANLTYSLMVFIVFGFIAGYTGGLTLQSLLSFIYNTVFSFIIVAILMNFSRLKLSIRNE